MEVHSHTHTPRKKWHHYFWEFFMLFLAVFCGFLAENQREHIVDHRQEKQYMKSLLEDLQTDTIVMNRTYDLGIAQKSKLDSLIDLVDYQPMNDANVMKLYMLQGETLRFLNISFEDRTASQLKNAGGMRLIRNKKVSDTIREYWGLVETILAIRNRLEKTGEDISDLSVRLFHTKNFIRPDNPLNPPLGIKPDAKLVDDDPKLLVQYVNRVSAKRSRTIIYISSLEECRQVALGLMNLIRKEYHLQ